RPTSAPYSLSLHDALPICRVRVDGFWIDEKPVTNAEFRRFIKATGYRTVAERAPDPALYPDADPALLVPGSLVFQRPSHRVPLEDRKSTRLNSSHVKISYA